MIRHTILAVLMLITPVSPAIAQARTPEQKAAKVEDICPNIEEFARATMEARQNGVSMSAAMNVPVPGDETYEILRAIIRAAYLEPRYGSEPARTRAAEDFANTYAQVCYETAEEMRKGGS